MQFLVWSGVAFAPLSAVYIADYFVLRGQRIHLRDLYDAGPTGRYAFLGGFNPAGAGYRSSRWAHSARPERAAGRLRWRLELWL